MAKNLSAQQSPPRNHLLAALPAADYVRLLPQLELLPLPLGWAVYESGSEQGYVYFPATSIVSLLYVMQDGSSAEIAVVGNEGVVGIALFMGGETTPSRAVVQSAGFAYRLKASVLKGEFERGGPLQHLLLRYTQALITQMAQTAVCNRHHAVEQQLCRWLLLSLDRLALERTDHDPGADCQHAGRAPRRRDRGRRQAAGGGTDPLQPRQDHRAGPCETGSTGLRVLCGGQTRIRSLASGYPA
jgi:hypothetical protein